MDMINDKWIQYEGTQKGIKVKSLIEELIENSQNRIEMIPTVIFIENGHSEEIDYSKNSLEYKDELYEISKKIITENDYSIFLEYSEKTGFINRITIRLLNNELLTYDGEQTGLKTIELLDKIYEKNININAKNNENIELELSLDSNEYYKIVILDDEIKLKEIKKIFDSKNNYFINNIYKYEKTENGEQLIIKRIVVSDDCNSYRRILKAGETINTVNSYYYQDFYVFKKVIKIELILIVFIYFILIRRKIKRKGKEN